MCPISSPVFYSFLITSGLCKTFFSSIIDFLFFAKIFLSIICPSSLASNYIFPKYGSDDLPSSV